MTKPTVFPDWAMVDTVDPTSGQTNVVEPNATKKDVGWVYNEKPPRQYFNWLARLTSQWIRWFDTEKMEEGTFTVKLKGDTRGSPPSYTIKYQRVGNFVHLSWRQILLPANTLSSPAYPCFYSTNKPTWFPNSAVIDPEFESAHVTDDVTHSTGLISFGYGLVSVDDVFCVFKGPGYGNFTVANIITVYPSTVSVPVS